MCRLFGLYANRVVGIYFSFYMSSTKSFANLSYNNPSGWGITWFDGVEWYIYKEPQPLHASTKAKELVKKNIRGKIIISHIRLASVGSEKEENTHPWLYKGWSFAHNGTIYNKQKLLRLLCGKYRNFKGETDSEMFFHLIVQEAENLRDPIAGITNTIKKIVNNGISFSSLNFIASDGRRLYALRYAATGLDRYTLYYIERPMGRVKLRKLSEETQQLIQTKLARGEKAIIIASECMSEEAYWEPLPNKHLVVINPNLDVKIIPIKL